MEVHGWSKALFQLTSDLFLWSVRRQAKYRVKRAVCFLIPVECAHTVAVAKKKDCMDTLVKWLNKRDDSNVTKLANSGLPKGAGKKGHKQEEILD